MSAFLHATAPPLASCKGSIARLLEAQSRSHQMYVCRRQRSSSEDMDPRSSTMGLSRGEAKEIKNSLDLPTEPDSKRKSPSLEAAKRVDAAGKDISSAETLKANIKSMGEFRNGEEISKRNKADSALEVVRDRPGISITIGMHDQGLSEMDRIWPTESNSLTICSSLQILRTAVEMAASSNYEPHHRILDCDRIHLGTHPLMACDLDALS